MLPFSPLIVYGNKIAPYQILYEMKQTAATQTLSYTITEDVKIVHVCIVGHGAASGGGLSYRNNIPVQVGDVFTINFSATGANSVYKNGSELICVANSGSLWSGSSNIAYGGNGGKNANIINDGGGNGGTATQGGSRNSIKVLGGAGGYSGSGGNGDLGSTQKNWYGAPDPNSGAGAGGVRRFSSSGGQALGGNVGLRGKTNTPTGSSSASADVTYNGENGSVSGGILCGGGVNSTTSNFNAGVVIQTGKNSEYK
ncbi:structural protein [Pectobacterium phage vB_PcaM_CBB]|uniref:Structural protein n=1 Tax=Pectobacterium phage vB_PcaM_CBB TaxID=2772511 RepID=A0A1L2CUM8_9CAUD|nr:structural protein [Pectobacterium phage vB_PcaM_CBB]AMM43709.1 structural protein [Pectobacterium phage vB_PcaM_CBB]